MQNWVSVCIVVNRVHHERLYKRVRASSAAGKSERFIARVPARVRPTPIARLRLLADNPCSGFPLRNEVVDETIHDDLVKIGY
jgi:hypothetical protein